ncbi:hypothetical protein F4V57_13720 [Acinetobacter qingfengensis]|uniref:Tetratricopeptide repeat protein n=2 Tax=Acinetobacter qingfengensis TaxID=1262585 RepID=A0A1E7REL4_9GAMM|nr:hypothetical protein [Acinetobacter qingfengensis]KAA8731135.1 hypothetical protein F4V57_13720 [Acinetobacter qingfengensis]OEY97804.1 hypothetical protein BJI46_07850 [Acinetobacter qingfengensis]
MKPNIFLLCFFLFPLSVSIHAATLRMVEVVCPIGGEKFSYHQAASGTSFGQTMDFKPIGAIIMPEPLAKCPKNGFIVDERFTQRDITLLTPYVESNVYQHLQKTEQPYYLLYRLRQQLPSKASDLQSNVNDLLQATWQASPSQYPKYANELLTQLNNYEKQPFNINFTHYYLLKVEIYRRMGQFSQAETTLTQFKKIFHQHFKSFEPEQQEYIQTYLAIQMQLIHQKNQNLEPFNPERLKNLKIKK